MGVLSRPTKIKAPPPVIRVEKVVVPSKPKPKPGPPRHTGSGLRASPSGARGASYSPSSSSRDGAARRPPSVARRRVTSASPYPSSTDEVAENRRKRRAPSSRSTPSENVKFSSDDDSSGSEGGGAWEDALGARHKRRRRDGAGRPVDLGRRLRHPRLWTGGEAEAEGGPEDGGDMVMIHAADVASLDLKCEPTLGVAEADVALELRYPGSCQPERYELVWGREKIDAVKDIMKVVNFVAYAYLSEKDASALTDPTTGLYRQLERASSKNVWDGQAFKTAVEGYNKRLLALQKDGTIAKTLDDQHDLSRELVAFILGQVYDRTVAPKVDLLAKYENGSDNVYGELLHPFVSNILIERLKMTSDQVFVDLGSGVGNVTLQAALEIGCESWGCEMMQNACDLAEAQEKEFSARCQLWGVAPGKVHLERGDFRTNDRVHQVLKRADVVLVNNQAFTSELNDNLVSMFLDLKSGCKVVSLKSFVHDHKSASNDVATSILQVEHLTYPSGYVSWTGAAGKFCISTRK